MGYWRIRAVLRDGRVFSNVFITSSWQIGFPDECPFEASDIVDFECTPDRTSSGIPVLESEIRSPPSCCALLPATYERTPFDRLHDLNARCAPVPAPTPVEGRFDERARRIATGPLSY